MLVALLFFGEIMLKLCSFFQIMPLFLKLCSLKKLQISPKNTFFNSKPLVYKKETQQIHNEIQ